MGHIITLRFQLSIFILFSAICHGVIASTISSCPAFGQEDENSVAILFPVPGECSSFYMCANGRLVKFHCGPGTVYNPELQVCDWPTNVQCENSTSTTQEDDSTTTTSAATEPDEATSVTSQEDDSASTTSAATEPDDATSVTSHEDDSASTTSASHEPNDTTSATLQEDDSTTKSAANATCFTP